MHRVDWIQTIIILNGVETEISLMVGVNRYRSSTGVSQIGGIRVTLGIWYTIYSTGQYLEVEIV